MRNPHRLILALWCAGYLSILTTGFAIGLAPWIPFALLLALAIPPLILHLRACSRVMRRTKSEHPNEWTAVNRPFELRLYLFDRRDFGDPHLARDKADLRWWLRAGVISVVMYLPTLLAISHFGTK